MVNLSDINWWPSLDYELQNPAGMVGRHIARRGEIIAMAARAQAGKDTGRLIASIHSRHLRDTRGQFVRVGSDVSYALAHHEGTKPHVIVPNRAKMLRFTSGGRVVYTRKVMHPGTRANRYLKDNLYLAII